jgi:hypothetical protein
MLRGLGDLRNYKIHAMDGDIGAVDDLLFDDRQWTVRYFVVDTGSWLPGRKILISPVAVGRAAWNSRQVRVLLTRDQIKDAPGVDTDKPVSRQEEERLAEYFAWPTYWTMPDPAAVPPALQRDVADQARRVQGESRNDDPHLRSVREVAGYRIEARDGSIGHVEDFIGDDSEWVIRYLVLDTRNWLPGKRVLVSPAWVDDVHWQRAQIRMDLDKEQIKNAPAYDFSTPINRAYETGLYDFYGRPPYWSNVPADANR